MKQETERPGRYRDIDENRNRQEQRESSENAPREDVIAGRNAVGEALRSGRAIDSVLVSRGDHTGSVVALIARCRDRGIPVKEADSRKLEELAGNSHQGIVALAACKEYVACGILLYEASRQRQGLTAR